jgi:hypothetical protein
MSGLEIKWESVSGAGGPALARTSVPGGWLVTLAGGGGQLVYVPDDEHDWGTWEEDDDDFED